MKKQFLCKSFCFAILLMLSTAVGHVANAQVITTIAGNGTAGYSGDGGAATGAELNQPWIAAVDSGGNVYFSDANNNRVRKVNLSGIITTVAGNGISGYGGDGGPATAAELKGPWGITIDGGGNLFIADNGNHRIRKVNTLGIISTIAGNGTGGFGGDGGSATASQLHNPSAVAFDGIGNLYIADNYNYRVRKIAPSGIITTIAGNGTAGYSGNGGPATGATLQDIEGIATDWGGNVYIADPTDMMVRKITPAGMIYLFAGTGTGGFSGDGGQATAAQLEQPIEVSVDRIGNVYIVDLGNYRIRKVTTLGVISTIAGTGAIGFSGDGGAATLAEIGYTTGVTADIHGNLYVVDQGNQRIRKISSCYPVAASISGADSLCPGAVTTLSDTATGGSWLSTNNSLATVSTTGVVTGVSAGTVNIEYVVSNSCGTDTAIYSVAVRSHASCTAGVANATISKLENIEIFPNPNKGFFALNLSSAKNEDEQIFITNSLGERVVGFVQKTNTERELQLHVPAGVYFVTAVAKSGDRIARRFIIE